MYFFEIGGSGYCFHNAYLGAFREDTAKNIWFRSNLDAYYNTICITTNHYPVVHDDSDILLYKFDLSIGDTLPIYNRLTTQAYIVDAIDSINSISTCYPSVVFDSYRKRYKIRNVENYTFYDPPTYDIDYWVEGIGSLSHFFQAILIGSTTPLLVADSSAMFYPNYSLWHFTENIADCPIFTNTRPITTANQLSITPNPFNEQLTISYLGEWQANIELSISTIQGVLVAQQKISATNQFSHTLDLANLPAGIYLVSATSNKGVWVQKVIKQQ